MREVTALHKSMREIKETGRHQGRHEEPMLLPVITRPSKEPRSRSRSR